MYKKQHQKIPLDHHVRKWSSGRYLKHLQLTSYTRSSHFRYHPSKKSGCKMVLTTSHRANLAPNKTSLGLLACLWHSNPCRRPPRGWNEPQVENYKASNRWVHHVSSVLDLMYDCMIRYALYHKSYCILHPMFLLDLPRALLDRIILLFKTRVVQGWSSKIPSIFHQLQVTLCEILAWKNHCTALKHDLKLRTLPRCTLELENTGGKCWLLITVPLYCFAANLMKTQYINKIKARYLHIIQG